MPPLPTHLAIIPDGNRRWAKNKGLPAIFGHRAGAKTTEKILTAALEQGIPYLTFWGASLSNVTKRDAKEINFLFKLFAAYFKKIAAAKLIHKNQVNIQVLGRWRDYFPPACQKAIAFAMEKTRDYRAFHLTILLAYNGDEELVSAIRQIVSGGHQADAITSATIKNSLYTRDLPPVDLVIRTGDDPHLSTGFMMWDTADAQLCFSSKMWPDFSAADLADALRDYQQTARRGGK